uniref:Uncharacterized protein n=1 Tax=Glossina palpalis gambiensis TaxID=67801 RepID=A0A1B0BBG2_9MUSC
GLLAFERNLSFAANNFPKTAIVAASCHNIQLVTQLRLIPLKKLTSFFLCKIKRVKKLKKGLVDSITESVASDDMCLELNMVLQLMNTVHIASN